VGGRDKVGRKKEGKQTRRELSEIHVPIFFVLGLKRQIQMLLIRGIPPSATGGELLIWSSSMLVKLVVSQLTPASIERGLTFPVTNLLVEFC